MRLRRWEDIGNEQTHAWGRGGGSWILDTYIGSVAGYVLLYGYACCSGSPLTGRKIKITALPMKRYALSKDDV
jgi:hypothetical protein